MRQVLVVVICLWSAALIPLGVAAQPMSSPAVSTSNTEYDWRQIAGHFDYLASAIGTASVETLPKKTDDAAALEDLRIACSEPRVVWARRLILSDCFDDASCASRKASMERLARGLADEVDTRLNDSAPAAQAFLIPGMSLRASVTDTAQSLSLRSAHDQWFRNWLDPKMMAQENAVTRDEVRIMNRVWCDMLRENAEVAIRHVTESGFPSDSPDSAQRHLVPALINIAIHAAWSPQLTNPLRAASDQAFQQGRLSGYQAAYMVDIDTMAKLSAQRVGFLWACDGSRAYPSPPLVDELEAAELRRQYGLPTLEATQVSRSRQCTS